MHAIHHIFGAGHTDAANVFYESVIDRRFAIMKSSERYLRVRVCLRVISLRIFRHLYLKV